jgi:hypothetical protein
MGVWRDWRRNAANPFVIDRNEKSFAADRFATRSTPAKPIAVGTIVIEIALEQHNAGGPLVSQQLLILGMQCRCRAQTVHEMLPDALKSGHLLLTSRDPNKRSAFSY